MFSGRVQWWDRIDGVGQSSCLVTEFSGGTGLMVATGKKGNSEEVGYCSTRMLASSMGSIASSSAKRPVSVSSAGIVMSDGNISLVGSGGGGGG
jgi:hypothetical protein